MGSSLDVTVAEGSIRLGILKAEVAYSERGFLRSVAEGSIRLGILKDHRLEVRVEGSDCCRGLDPIGDTESRCLQRPQFHAACCRGLDPIGDTERGAGGVGGGAIGMLQRARSDWGY